MLSFWTLCVTSVSKETTEWFKVKKNTHGAIACPAASIESFCMLCVTLIRKPANKKTEGKMFTHDAATNPNSFAERTCTSSFS